MLKIFNQITHSHTKGLGNSHQGMDAHRLFSAFNLAEIDGMQIGLFRQLFLAHFTCFPMYSDGVPD